MTDRDRLIGSISKAKRNYNMSTMIPIGTTFESWVADYLLADGWIRLPCKVGDKVYYFSDRPFNLSLQENTIYEATVVRIVTNRITTSLVIQIHNEYGVTEVPEITYFGKSVFLTKEQAERELKKRGEQNACND